MLRQTFSVAVLVGSGTVAGALFAVALSMVPALMAMTPDRYLHAHRLLGRNWDPTMPAVVLGSMLLDVALAARAPTPPVRALFACSALLLLGVAVVSHLCNVPINRRMRALNPEALPPDWEDPRRVWRNWHLLRTTFAVLALAGNSLAVTLA